MKSPVDSTPLKSIATVSLALMDSADMILFVVPAADPLGTSDKVSVAALAVVLQMMMFLMIVVVLAGAV
jgi:hypothetical protein